MPIHYFKNLTVDVERVTVVATIGVGRWFWLGGGGDCLTPDLPNFQLNQKLRGCVCVCLGGGGGGVLPTPLAT